MSEFNLWRPNTPIWVNQRAVQLERVAQEAGFLSNSDCQEWLESDAIEPFFTEFRLDFLRESPLESHPDHREMMTTIVVNEILGHVGLNRYLQVEPNKTNWEVKNHYACFIVKAMHHARDHETLWDLTHLNGDVVDEVTEMSRILFLALQYLVHCWRDTNLSPPSDLSVD
jgi:hypothetical protein